LVVPYKGKQLKGEELLKQLKKWADYGTIEPAAAEAISAVVKNSTWADLSDKYFVLLGAGSAMGPFLVLMALGANIIAVDLDRAPIWKRLLSVAEQSSGTITFPLKKPQAEIKSKEELYEQSGSNLITQALNVPPEHGTTFPFTTLRETNPRDRLLLNNLHEEIVRLHKGTIDLSNVVKPTMGIIINWMDLWFRAGAVYQPQELFPNEYLKTIMEPIKNVHIVNPDFTSSMAWEGGLDGTVLLVEKILNNKLHMKLKPNWISNQLHKKFIETIVLRPEFARKMRPSCQKFGKHFCQVR